MIQEAMFAPAAQGDMQLPPAPPKPVVCAEPIGPCCKCGAPDGTVRSPSGSIYCANCGQCKRVEVVTKNDKVVYDIHGNTVTKRICTISVEDFVWWGSLKMHVCPCVVRFAVEAAKREKESVK